MVSTVKFYSLTYRQVKTYLIATILIIGNILLPLLCHSIPQGGLIFLPIYFFTLFGAYKYGLKPGLLIACLSPVLNHLLTGMPPVGMLPIILVKSCLLAIAAAYAAKHFNKVSILILVGVVLFYQLTGFLFEWVYSGSFFAATQDFRLAIPGMLIQIFGIYGIIKLKTENGKRKTES